jgi:hypothetical protein
MCGTSDASVNPQSVIQSILPGCVAKLQPFGFWIARGHERTVKGLIEFETGWPLARSLTISPELLPGWLEPVHSIMVKCPMGTSDISHTSQDLNARAFFVGNYAATACPKCRVLIEMIGLDAGPNISYLTTGSQLNCRHLPPNRSHPGRST